MNTTTWWLWRSVVVHKLDTRGDRVFVLNAKQRPNTLTTVTFELWSPVGCQSFRWICNTLRARFPRVDGHGRGRKTSTGDGNRSPRLRPRDTGCWSYSTTWARSVAVLRRHPRRPRTLRSRLLCWVRRRACHRSIGRERRKPRDLRSIFS